MYKVDTSPFENITSADPEGGQAVRTPAEKSQKYGVS